MTARDPEAALRARIERSVADLPGPDPARLGAVRRRLRTRRPKRSPLPWLAAAIAVALGSAATAAYVMQQQAGSESSRERVQEVADDESATTLPDTGSTTTERNQDEPAQEGAADPVIYRD